MHLGESTEPLRVALHSPWKYTRFSLIGYTGIYTVSILLRARVTKMLCQSWISPSQAFDFSLWHSELQSAVCSNTCSPPFRGWIHPHATVYLKIIWWDFYSTLSGKGTSGMGSVLTEMDQYHSSSATYVQPLCCYGNYSRGLSPCMQVLQNII